MSAECYTLYSSATSRIELFTWPARRSAKIAFVFAPSMNRNLDGNGYGGQLLLKNGFDVVSIKITDDTWYQNIPAEVLSSLTDLCEQYDERVGYGSSMGGYAAICFSKQFRFDRVLALSPQFSISEDFDRRWKAYSQKVSWVYRIDVQTISPNCHFFVCFDNLDLDGAHASRIATLIQPQKYHPIMIPYGGHPAAHYLHEVDALRDFAIGILTTGEVCRKSLKLKKSSSKSYLYNLSVALFKRGKYRLSLSVIDKALSLDESLPSVHAHKAYILAKLSDISAAIRHARRSIDLDPTSPYISFFLSGLLLKNGELTDALEASRAAVLLAPDNAQYLRQHLHILSVNN